MRPGTSAGGTSVPRSRDERTSIEPIGSGSWASIVVRMSAPIDRSTSRNAVRAGLSSTPSMRTSESGRMSAATTRKAALSAPPGMTRRVPVSRAGPSMDAVRPSRWIVTPNSGSRRSV